MSELKVDEAHGKLLGAIHKMGNGDLLGAYADASWCLGVFEVLGPPMMVDVADALCVLLLKAQAPMTLKVDDLTDEQREDFKRRWEELKKGDGPVIFGPEHLYRPNNPFIWRERFVPYWHEDSPYRVGDSSTQSEE